MSFSFNSALRNEGDILIKEWNEIGMLDEIDSKTERLNLAVALENQRLYNAKYLKEQATDSGDISQFKRISIPLVRRIYPQLIANKIVSVQPLLGPTGLVYYLRFRYSSNKGATRGATQTGFPGDDNLSLQQVASGLPNLDIWYTHQFVSNETQANPGGGTILQYQLERTPILAGTVTGSVYDGGVLAGTFIVSQTGTFTTTLIGSPALNSSGHSLNLVTGVLQLSWASDPGANSVIANYEQNLEGQADLPEVNMVIESDDIQAVTRKLKAVWTYEAEQDLRSQHNLSAEEELTSVLAQEINLEIDREVLTDLRNNAGTVSAWDFSTALGDTIKERYEALYVKLVEVSNLVHKKTLRGGCNWIVCSPEVASIFEAATAGFAPTMSDTFVSSLGVQYVGTINSRWRMYKDPLFPVGQILMGYKGENTLDSGYYYCPYVPLTQTPIIFDPDNLTPRRGLMTRYGKKLLRDGSKYFARLSVQNFSV